MQTTSHRPMRTVNLDAKRWLPQREYSKQDQFLMKRGSRTRKLLGFLRETRHELISRDSRWSLLQAYDADAVELSVGDPRWQMVLVKLGTTEPALLSATFAPV